MCMHVCIIVYMNWWLWIVCVSLIFMAVSLLATCFCSSLLMAECGEQGVNGVNKGMRGGKGNSFSSNGRLFIGCCCINYFRVSIIHTSTFGCTHTLYPFGIRTHFSLLVIFSLQGLSGPDVHACSYDRRLVSSSLFSYFWWDQREQEQRGKWEELCQVFSHECLLYCREGNWEKKHREREREGGGLCHLTQGLFPLEGGRDERREKKSGWTIGEQQKQWGVC